MKMRVILSLVLGLSHVSSVAFARPEYAALTKMNCTQCHVTPWGGGPRTVQGKVFGAHGHPPGKLSDQAYIYGDVRFIGYYPNQLIQSPHGIALMQASVSGNAALIEGEKNSEMRGLLTYNMAPLSGSSVREAYIRWALPQEGNEAPVSIVVGRFYVPFGLLTDEHRTYTRIQTNMTYNNFHVGAAVSGNFFPALHMDLVLVNDFQTGGNFTQGDLSWATVLNFRWNPQNLPFLLGASGNFQRLINTPQPLASSLYGVLSLDQLTQNSLKGSLSIERVDARNWNNPAVNTGMLNPNLTTFFIPRSELGYQRLIATASSLGYYGWARFNLLPELLLFYKLDYLALDRNTPEDAFLRHGVGVEIYPNSNLILNIRYEKAAGMRPEIAASNVLAAQDDVFAMLRVWL
jgi:hypothetical protein